MTLYVPDHRSAPMGNLHGPLPSEGAALAVDAVELDEHPALVLQELRVLVGAANERWPRDLQGEQRSSPDRLPAQLVPTDESFRSRQVARVGHLLARYFRWGDA